MFTFTVRGIDFSRQNLTSAVFFHPLEVVGRGVVGHCRRQILTSEVDPRTVRVNPLTANNYYSGI